MLLVHGLIRVVDHAVVADLPAEPIHARVVVDGSLAAVVSTAPDRELTPEDAVAHLDVLIALVASVPVLPLSLGTLAPDDDAVRQEVLAPGAARFLRQLEALQDLVELRLGLEFDTDATVAAVAAQDSEIRSLATRTRRPGAGLGERVALGEAVASHVAALEDALTEKWTGELAGLAERDVALAADEQIRRMAYLVRRERLPAADAAVARLRAAADAHAAVEYVGPLPAYSFLDEVDTGASPPPTSRWGW